MSLMKDSKSTGTDYNYKYPIHYSYWLQKKIDVLKSIKDALKTLLSLNFSHTEGISKNYIKQPLEAKLWVITGKPTGELNNCVAIQNKCF